jgi:hypothetical protein
MKRNLGRNVRILYLVVDIPSRLQGDYTIVEMFD